LLFLRRFGLLLGLALERVDLVARSLDGGTSTSESL